MTPIIVVDHLRKIYGTTVAVDDLSFTVEQGEIFGLLGPNGAGKTTTVECLEGLRRPDGGRVAVLGHDPWRERHVLVHEIGVQLQESALPDQLKVREALDLFGSFYRRTRDAAQLLEQLGLAEQARTPFAKLSGGQKQRLFIALALIHDPQVLFLDELTTGLDPQARRAIWEFIRQIREHGKTILLTTHYMEEAQALCDRIAIIDRGRLIALDSPANLVRQFAGQVRVLLQAGATREWDWLRQIPGVSAVEFRDGQVVITVCNEQVVSEIIQALAARGIPPLGLTVQHGSLEDVFLTLTGQQVRD
ncbi:MAG: ABC transporter ATP-binding protein [Thermorudis peleae]|nr:ABC transporter ATP-binding protein [Thermorudis peleae]